MQTSAIRASQGACLMFLLTSCAMGCASNVRRDPRRDAGSVRTDASTEDAGRPVDGGVDGGPGLCTGVDCSSFDDVCTSGVCDPVDGTCSAVVDPDGAACDDGSACTSGEACAAGACTGGSPFDCTALDSACAIGVCDPAGASCVAMPLADGTACDDGDRCTTADRCTTGACGGAAVDCSAMGNMCNVGACNAGTGTCTATPAADGTACNDMDACTTADVCTAGTCAGTSTSCSAYLVPGRTDLVSTRGGWSVRCLAWTAQTCTHGQARMDCSVCPTYASCGVWHDVTSFNDGDNRCSVNFCALATGSAVINSTGTGAATAVAPRACGWGSTVHPLCEAGQATYSVPVAGVTANYGLLLNDTYCGAETTLRTFDCGGW